MSVVDRLLGRVTRLPGVRPLLVRYPLGSIPTRVRHDLWTRPHYAYGIYSAADLAKRLDLPAISIIEFGVAGGRGLLAMEEIARKVAAYTGVRISTFGFDSGQGMPAPQDYRDLPHVWDTGFYSMDESALRKQLRDAELILGKLDTTIPQFLSGSVSPIGFISFDLDYYSSTMQAFQVFKCEPAHRLPRIYCYFDEIFDPEICCHNEYIGELAAIKDFNAASSQNQKLCPLNLLRNTRANPAAWNDQIYVMHDFAHPLYCKPLHSQARELPL
jgi:hypothetical protein